MPDKINRYDEWEGAYIKRENVLLPAQNVAEVGVVDPKGVSKTSPEGLAVTLEVSWRGRLYLDVNVVTEVEAADRTSGQRQTDDGSTEHNDKVRTHMGGGFFTPIKLPMRPGRRGLASSPGGCRTNSMTSASCRTKNWCGNLDQSLSSSWSHMSTQRMIICRQRA